jgi:copper chaperone CopZ
MMATMMLRLTDLESKDEERLEALLRSMDGVFGVVVSPSKGCVEVDLEDDEVDLDHILDRLEEAGYEAQLAG